ncbi:DUF72 domain-containing protein [Sphingomonas sp. URHD0057]|uniref:DUF72 domain-containing protein n=1 Tax=Sphingomonas sp. URHD0057 TaxID=1380389 RepID=UPI00048CCFA0|nr:DUF72 domain-containing protein [Sphingomonas sp. URHD0057]
MERSTVSNGRVHVGCSGWVYRHWKGSFYPEGLPQKRWFERYASEFDTVEINASFYRLPLASTFDKWHDQAPPGFRYAVKANRFITHMKKLKDCEEALDTFVDLAQRLKSYLGPILYQLPPSLHKDLPRLEPFLNLLPTSVEHVFEFRHNSWYHEDVLALLDRHGAGFVTHDLVGLKTPRWASGRTAYVRLHGTGGKYRGRYSDGQLHEWAEWLLAQRDEGRSVWAYFNNDIGGDAIEDARTLKGMVADGEGA